jgi:hypothetical protein
MESEASLLQCLQFLSSYLLVSEVAVLMGTSKLLRNCVQDNCYSITCKELNSSRCHNIKNIFHALRELNVLEASVASYVDLGRVLDGLSCVSLSRCVVPVPSDGLMSKREFPRLRRLSLRSCNSVTLAYALSCCTQLEYLELDVIFEDIRQILFKLLRNLNKLRQFRISRLLTPSLEPLSICLPNLELLSITKSGCVREIHLERSSCEKLLMIDVSQSGVTSRQLVRFVEQCPNLRSLFAVACDAIVDTVEFTSHKLKKLNLKFTRVQVLKLNCPQLSLLNISQCDDLYRLELTAHSISSLNASMLNLSYMKICAHNLSSLLLRGTATIKQYLVTDNLNSNLINVNRNWDRFQGVLILDNCWRLKPDLLMVTNSTSLTEFNHQEYLNQSQQQRSMNIDDYFDSDSDRSEGSN